VIDFPRTTSFPPLTLYAFTKTLKFDIVNDSEKDKDYIGAYNVDYGYFLLTKENEMAVLNG
jgi:hypothetical protein